MLTQVGKYLIEEKIGVGGFGTVYKGRDPFIKRAVAIKTCQSDEEEIKKRFFREAEFAGNLHHRNITTIYDFGVTDDGTPYIVQEFLTGEDLDKVVKKREPMSLKRKLAILVDVCEGLGYAHEAGIIHRDIKPSNVRILADGVVKLMDFGIAKSMVTPSTLTQTGITLGTASYLAPEQIRGEQLDPRTDLFSLGVLAYELVTGQKPFTGDHISTVLYKIMNEHPSPPSTLLPGLPRSLDTLVLKCLEKDRGRRYGTCAELKRDCAAVLASLPEGASPQAVPADMERTVPTPSTGYTTGSGAPAPVRVSDAPILTSAPASAPRGGVADVRLRTTGGPAGITPPSSDKGPALRVFLSAAVVLLAGGGAFYLYTQKKAPRPQPVEAAPPATASSVPAGTVGGTASPATAATAPDTTSASLPATAAAAPTTAEPEPSSAAASSPAPAPPPPEPAPKVVESSPVPVTFRSNQVGILYLDGKKHGSVTPAGTRVALKRGTHTAVFEVPGFMKLPPKTFEVTGPETRPVTAEFPAFGILALTVLPAGADVKIDGVSVGTSSGSTLKRKLATGPHEVVVSLAGYRTESRSIDLLEEQVSPYSITLKKE